MLFKIENCFPEKYSTESDKLLALSNILKSHGLRKNIVIADVATLNALDSSDLYGKLDKLYAKDILDNRREIGGLEKSLSIYVIVDFNQKTINCSIKGNRSTIRIGYNFFTDPDCMANISLITENNTDFKFYSKIAEYYASHISKLNLNVNFKNCLGAGSHCKSEFDRISNEGKLVLCIVDNDKKHPKKPEGSTSANFSSKDRSLDGMAFVKVIDTREAENLIPTSLTETLLVKKVADKINAFDEIKTYIQKNSLFHSYFDFKEGMTLKEFIDLDRAYGNFWLDIISINRKFSERDCFKTKTCHVCENCPKVEGLGNSLLSHVVMELEQRSLWSLTQNLDKHLSSYWMDIGGLMQDWGCTIKGGAVRT